MLCLLSLIVFSFLGIFFTGYRELARESFRCFTQRVKTGECDADFETRLKSTIVGKAMEKDKRLARFLNQYIEYITWILLLLLVISAAFAAFGFYNYIMYGDCTPGTSGGCSLNKASKINITGEIKESLSFWLSE